MKQLHKAHPIDIIESAELGLALLSHKHPAKKVIRLHGGHHFFAEAEKRGINWRKGLLEKRSFKKADAFIAVSKYVKDHTGTFLSYHSKPVEIIPHPLDNTMEKPEVTVKEDHILFAGTVCEKKGVRQLIEAFKLVRQKYPQKMLNIFGRDWFFPNGASYIEMLKSTYDASYFENVVFHGSIPRNELNIRYAEAAFCVFPSHMETQGLVTLEAMLLQNRCSFLNMVPVPKPSHILKTDCSVMSIDPKILPKKCFGVLKTPRQQTPLV